MHDTDNCTQLKKEGGKHFKTINILAVLQTRESLPVVLRVTYPENQVALTEGK